MQHYGVPAAAAQHVASLPPVSSLLAAVLGVNPVRHLLAPTGVLPTLSSRQRHVLTGREFFPQVISGPFQQGLTIVFSFCLFLAVVSVAASALRSPSGLA